MFSCDLGIKIKGRNTKDISIKLTITHMFYSKNVFNIPYSQEQQINKKMYGPRGKKNPEKYAYINGH